MGKLTFGYVLAIIFMMSGCVAHKSGASKEIDIVGKKWQVVELSGQPVAEKINGKMPYLELLKEEGRYAASGGCNGIGGSYTLSKKNGISFSLGISTMMACTDMSAEQGLKAVFKDAKSYTVDGEALTLQNEQGQTIAKFKQMQE